MSDADSTSEPEAETIEQTDDADPEAVVRACIEDARTAMEGVADYDQPEADALARAAAWAIYREDNAESLVETTLEATGMGNGPDTRGKVRDRVKGILHDALGTDTVGVVEERDGVVEVAKPVGVVGGLVPSTNPAPTAANLAVLALKGRNALVLSASPSGFPPTAEAVEYIREELAAVGAPRDLVQVLPTPASKAKSAALVDMADLVQVTGSAANVRAGQESGTPNYCVSAGNPVALVDDTVDLERVAADIAGSAAYDEGITCIAESCAVVPEDRYEAFRDSLAAAGGSCCTREETDRLRETLFPGGEGPARDAIGQSAPDLAAEAGVDVPADTAVLVVEPEDPRSDPLVTECLSPILTTLAVEDFEAGLSVTERILGREGAGHSVAVHTDDRERAVAVGRRVDVCRMVVNQPNLGSAGTFQNGLTHTLSMGGGTWAGNQLAGNLSAREFVQTTSVAFPTDGGEPSDEAVFGPHPRFDGADDPAGPSGTAGEDAGTRGADGGLLSRLTPW
ncbi:MAG: aldehyde dehydrogenase family protein [Haloarculaceae archaeon]